MFFMVRIPPSFVDSCGLWYGASSEFGSGLGLVSCVESGAFFEDYGDGVVCFSGVMGYG